MTLDERITKLAKRRVKKGAEFLLENDGTLEYIRTDLDMENYDTCALANRAAWRDVEPNYYHERDELGLTEANAIARGFNAPDGLTFAEEQEYFRLLDEEWKKRAGLESD